MQWGLGSGQGLNQVQLEKELYQTGLEISSSLNGTSTALAVGLSAMQKTNFEGVTIRSMLENAAWGSAHSRWGPARTTF